MPFLKDRSKITRSQRLKNITLKHGLRHAIFNVLGDRYIGEWQYDHKTGKGALLNRFRQLYEGDFVDGYRHGFGVLAYEKEDKIFYLEYRGFWIKNKMHGFGVRRYRDGAVYVGWWKYGKRHGYGLMWYTNGDFFSGDFINDKREGLGILVRPDGSRYEGRWLNDMKHGKGRFFHLLTGQIQEGVWIRDDCVYSTFKDLRYRQTITRPTPYPIQKNELLNMEELCQEFEMKALMELVHSCLSIHESLEEELT